MVEELVWVSWSGQDGSGLNGGDDRLDPTMSIRWCETWGSQFLGQTMHMDLSRIPRINWCGQVGVGKVGFPPLVERTDWAPLCETWDSNILDRTM